MPTLVIDKAYAGGIGIPIRYYGLATHANTLAPLAVVFMICLWRFPSIRVGSIISLGC